MKHAEFKRYKYLDGRREIYAIWLHLWYDMLEETGSVELFYGPVTEYRVKGWERHTTQLIVDSMKLVLSLAQFDVRGDV